MKTFLLAALCFFTTPVLGFISLPYIEQEADGNLIVSINRDWSWDGIIRRLGPDGQLKTEALMPNGVHYIGYLQGEMFIAYRFNHGRIDLYRLKSNLQLGNRITSLPIGFFIESFQSRLHFKEGDGFYHTNYKSTFTQVQFNSEDPRYTWTFTSPEINTRPYGVGMIPKGGAVLFAKDKHECKLTSISKNGKQEHNVMIQLCHNTANSQTYIHTVDDEHVILIANPGTPVATMINRINGSVKWKLSLSNIAGTPKGLFKTTSGYLASTSGSRGTTYTMFDDSGQIIWTQIYVGDERCNSEDLVETVMPDGTTEYSLAGLGMANRNVSLCVHRIDDKGDTLWTKYF